MKKKKKNQKYVQEDLCKVIIIKKLVKNKILKGGLLVLFLFGLFSVLITTPMFIISIFSDTTIVSEPLIKGLLGGILNISGIITMLITIILLLIIHNKNEEKCDV